jgi:hypothetical protein
MRYTLLSIILCTTATSACASGDEVEPVAEVATTAAADPESATTSAVQTGEPDVIGRWRDSRPFMDVIAIYSADGQFSFEQQFQDGSRRTGTLSASESARGQVFREEGDLDYWILNRAGNLELWDEQGQITTAQSITQ